MKPSYKLGARIMLPVVGTLVLALFDDALTFSTFESKLSKPKAAFIKFYAPWRVSRGVNSGPCEPALSLQPSPWLRRCSHCQEMAANWDQLGEHFEDDKSLLIGSVDCDDNKALCSRFSITGFPTLLWFMPPDPLSEVYHDAYSAVNLTRFAMELHIATSNHADAVGAPYRRAAELGIDGARERFAEIRTHLRNTRLQFEQAVNMMQQEGISDQDKSNLADEAKEAQDALTLIQEKVGAEYRALKAYLAPHGGTPLPEGEAAARQAKKKKKRKAKAAKGKDEV